MRRFFRWASRVLLLVVIFMVSALTAMRFAIRGRELRHVIGTSIQIGRDLVWRQIADDFAHILAQFIGPAALWSHAGEQIRRNRDETFARKALRDVA